MASQIPAAALARYRSPAVLGLAARLWPVRALSSYNVEQSAMQALLTTPSESSNLPTDTLVFVLCTAEQVAVRRMRMHTCSAFLCVRVSE